MNAMSAPRSTLGHAAMTGAVAGLAGGLAFGLVLLQLDVLPSMGLLLLAGSPVLAFIGHMMIAAIVGSGFGVLARWFRSDPGETVSLGLAYGALWWYLGPLTLLPLLLALRPAWEFSVVQQQFPALLGHLLYGTVTGLALALLRPREGAGTTVRVGVGGILRGVAAGVLGAWLVAAIVDDRLGLRAMSAVAPRSARLTPLAAALLVGPLAGMGYALLHPRPAGGAGLALVRGQVYGFLWWVVGALTVMPLLEGRGLPWTVGAVREGFAALPGLVVLGVTVALLHRWLGALGGAFLPDRTRHDRARVSSGGLSALGRDALAGSVGGLLFTLVMTGSGFLTTVAGLVGSDSTAAGFVIHLLISIGVGISYGRLFRHQSRALGTALGWGLSYGFFWWVVGPLTLLPMLMGGPPMWAAPAAAASFSSLIGHLVFGIGLGLTFHLLELRFGALPPSPEPTGEIGPAALSDEHVLAAASPLLGVMIVMIMTVPVVLATSTNL
jgi:uncharacterized membrane protein YagU involved in acid resistance